MDRDIARNNIRTGLKLGALSSLLFGLSFVIAIIYNAA